MKPQGTIAGLFMHTRSKGIDAVVTSKLTGQTVDVVLANPKENTAELKLEQTMTFTSNAIKALIISKEISHFAYFGRIKQRIVDQFNDHFTLATSSTLPIADILFTSSVFGIPINTTLKMSFEYRNAQTLLDWAGYWHITPALGRMLKQGLLADDDKQTLTGNINAFNLSSTRGLLREQKPGIFIWQDGVTPFSKQWREVMQNITGVPPLLDPQAKAYDLIRV